MKRPTDRHLLLLSAIVMPVVLMASPSAIHGAVLYHLAESSSYLEGCFDPCMCPIMMNQTLQGTFLVVPTGGDGEAGVFDIVAVDWRLVRDDKDVPVTGTGRYTRDLRQQRLELDLQVDAQPVRHFDSGLVPIVSAFPAIAADVSVNGFFCYDHAFTIAAHPSGVGAQVETWGGLKSTYR